MRRTLVCVLVGTIVGAVALVWAGSAQAPRRPGTAERLIFEDRQVCKNGGRFVVAYTEQRPLSIVIETASGSQLAARFFTPKARTYTFDPTLDPLQTGFREFSSRFKFRWPQKLEPGTSLVVNIFGDPDANPETFPNSSNPAPIAVAKCRLSKGDDHPDKDDCGDDKDDNDDNDDKGHEDNDDKGDDDNDDNDDDEDDNNDNDDD